MTTTTAIGHRPDIAPTIDLAGEATSPVTLLRALWARRDLVVLLARKEFQVRYRRTSFGTLWAVAIPLIQSAVMAVVFSKVTRLQVGHYPIFMLSGMVAWTYFAAVFGSGGTAIVDQADLSSRVYFPRIALPVVSGLTNLYGLVITLVITLCLCPAFGVTPRLSMLLFVPAIALLALFSTAVAIVSSALHVYFRDIRYIITASILLLLYGSPVIYTPTTFHGALRDIITANPLTGILDLFHAATVGAGGPLNLAVAVSCLWTVAILAAALVLASRFDRVFADLL